MPSNSELPVSLSIAGSLLWRPIMEIMTVALDDECFFSIVATKRYEKVYAIVTNLSLWVYMDPFFRAKPLPQMGAVSGVSRSLIYNNLVPVITAKPFKCDYESCFNRAFRKILGHKP